LLCAVALRRHVVNGVAPDYFWVLMAFAGIQINLVLMALILFPLPPLDGGRIVFSLLPSHLAWKYAKLEPYGLMILIVLMLTGVLWMLLKPLLAFGQAVVTWFL